MSSSMWSILEIVAFFLMAVGPGVHQLWALKKLEIQRRKREARSTDASSGA